MKDWLKGLIEFIFTGDIRNFIASFIITSIVFFILYGIARFFGQLEDFPVISFWLGLSLTNGIVLPKTTGGIFEKPRNK